MPKLQKTNSSRVEDTSIRVLVIDDNDLFCDMLSHLIRKLGMIPTCEYTLKKGVHTAKKEAFDVILLDVHLPDGSGLDIIPTLQKGPDPPEIIIITGKGHEEGAEIAIKNQAWDYIPKDASLQNLRLSLNRAIQYRKQKKTTATVPKLKRDNIIGKSSAIATCIEKASQAAGSNSPVLILGETGTGKEIFATTIHENSSRAKKDFVVVNCSALPAQLVESILFGHKKGAYTSADSERVGLIEQAHSGTLFLDEIGELTEEIQKKFLRVLQEKCFRPLGAKKEEKSDFRIICATNRDLSEMVKEGTFRQDLYYRIRSIVIDLPPLRSRKEDIPELVEYYTKRHCELTGAGAMDMSQDFLESLLDYDWPGNIRELFNVLNGIYAEIPEDALVFSRHLPDEIRTEVARNRIRSFAGKSSNDRIPPDSTGSSDLIPLKELLDETRAAYIKNLMECTRGNITEACKISGLSRGHLYDLTKKFKIRTG